jgi:hypothetical protein
MAEKLVVHAARLLKVVHVWLRLGGAWRVVLAKGHLADEVSLGLVTQVVAVQLVQDLLVDVGLSLLQALRLQGLLLQLVLRQDLGDLLVEAELARRALVLLAQQRLDLTVLVVVGQLALVALLGESAGDLLLDNRLVGSLELWLVLELGEDLVSKLVVDNLATDIILSSRVVIGSTAVIRVMGQLTSGVTLNVRQTSS